MNLSNLSDRGTLRGTLQRNSGNYNDLINKPAINGHTLIGNQSGHALGLANEDDIINVEVNPLGSATADLHKILVDNTIYSIPDVVVYGTASGAIASFDDGGDNKPLKSLKVAINPVQKGSGDPNPSNVRPISGWDEVKVNVSPTQDAEDGTTYTIDLDGTRYGGTLDVVSGELTADMAIVDLGTLSWTKNTSYAVPFFVGGIIATIANSPDILSPIYKTTTSLSGVISNNCSVQVSNKNVRIRDDRYDTKEAFVDAMDGIIFVYPLATPITFQLTPTQVKSLLGNNNIWSDTGEILECVYQRDLNIVINQFDARITALEQAQSGTRSLSLSKSAVKEEETEEITEEPKEEETK